MLNICPNFSAAPLTLQSVVTILSKFDFDSNTLPPIVLSKDMRVSMQAYEICSYVCILFSAPNADITQKRKQKKQTIIYNITKTFVDLKDSFWAAYLLRMNLLLLYAYTLILCVMQSVTRTSSWDLGQEKVRLWSNKDHNTPSLTNRLTQSIKKNRYDKKTNK